AEEQVLREQGPLQALPDPHAQGGHPARRLHGQEAQAGQDQGGQEEGHEGGYPPGRGLTRPVGPETIPRRLLPRRHPRRSSCPQPDSSSSSTPRSATSCPPTTSTSPARSTTTP